MVDQAELEEKQVAAEEPAKAEELKLTPAEQAGVDFHHLFPIFMKKLETMPKKSLARLVRRLIEFPLNEKEYKFMNQKEREMFFISRKLLDANLIMMSEVFQEKMNKTTEEVSSGTSEG